MTDARLVLPDQPARTRIVSELDRSLLVEAGAGSGKTHELAARMAAGVAAGVYEIERMAAVTFTRKAAAELRGRFQLALERELAASVGGDRVAPGGKGADAGVSAVARSADADLSAVARSAKADRIAHALSNIERFFAGTIHAFCARLLRERPVEAGVSPGFTELDEIEEALLRRVSWREYRAARRATGDRDLLRLDEAGIQARDLDKGFEMVCLHEDVDFSAPDVEAPDTEGAWMALDGFWRDLSSRLPSPVPDDTSCPSQLKAHKFERDWRLASRLPRTPAMLADLLRTWDFKPGITQNRWASDAAGKRRAKEIIVPLHQSFRDGVVTPWLRAWRQHLYAPCMRVLMAARGHAADERRRRNVLSFNDLLLLAARVLREDAGVRAALQRKYRHLFVDEFQDTDPVQAEIMTLLAGPGGTLFVVGDPKQSIYRFRRADIDVYNDMRARLGGPDGRGVVALTTNFRSAPAICAWANRVFERTFPATPDTWQPTFAPLEAKPGATDAGPGVCVLTIEESVDAKEVIEEEARRIARYILAEVQAGRRRFEDFLLLTRKKKRLLAYARAFEAQLVPIEVSGAGAFGESRDVRELSALIASLADPQDGVALVGVLRGPFFGLSDPQLFAYRQAGGRFSLFGDPPAGVAMSGEARAVAVAIETLRRWFRWTRLLPAGAALDRILEDSGALALAASSPGGADAGDLLHAVDRIRAVVESGFTLAEAAESIDEDADESSEVEALPLEPGRRGVMRLMNLHKAKGLEAPVVFLADPLGGYKPGADVRVVRTDAGANGAPSAHGWLPIVAKFGEHGERLVAEPADWDAHVAAEEKYLEAEAGRLLYVAATRAKELLVVGRYAKTGGAADKRAWEAFDPFLSGVPELPIPASVLMVLPAAADLSAAAFAHATTRIETTHAALRRPTWAATSVTAEAKAFPRLAIAAPGVDGDGEADDPTRAGVNETPSRRADAGAAWGSLVHGLLEHAMRHPSASREDLRRLALWLTVEEPGLRVLVDQAIDTARAVAASDRLRDARESAERHEEVPFAVVERIEGIPTVLAGTIDLVYRIADGWRLVDYKTDVDAAASTLDRKYAEQIAAYERAWARVSSGAVTSEIVSARGHV